MKKVRLVIDSTVDVAKPLREKFTVVPLSIHFGEQDYVDGITITHQEFYEKLVTSPVLPTTSQPTPEAFGEIFREAVEAGEQVVVLTISCKLSGTVQSAMIAAQDYPEDVFVVDSHSVTIGAGVLAEWALELAESGMPAAEIARRLTEERDNVAIIAMLDTLEYLKRGGRISKTVAFAGELLSIKPVIFIPEGEIQILGKARGTRQGNTLVRKEIEKAGGVDYDRPYLLGYTGRKDDLLRQFIAGSADLWSRGSAPDTTVIGSVVGTHAGPGAVAVAFFKKGSNGK